MNITTFTNIFNKILQLKDNFPKVNVCRDFVTGYVLRNINLLFSLSFYNYNRQVVRTTSQLTF